MGGIRKIIINLLGMTVLFCGNNVRIQHICERLSAMVTGPEDRIRMCFLGSVYTAGLTQLAQRQTILEKYQALLESRPDLEMAYTFLKSNFDHEKSECEARKAELLKINSKYPDLISEGRKELESVRGQPLLYVEMKEAMLQIGIVVE